MRTHFPSIIALAATALVGSLPAGAVVTAAAGSVYSEHPGLASAEDQSTNADTAPLNYSFARAMAIARIGYLAATAEAEGSDYSGGNMSATATFSDVLSINKDGLTGTQGYFIARILVSGTLTASSWNYNLQPYIGSGNSSYSVDISAASTGVSKSGSYTSNEFTEGYSGDLPGIITIPVAFTFGDDFDYFGRLTVSASGAGSSALGSQGYARAEFGHTLYLDGISEVFTMDDTPVTGYDISSLSGSDYITGFAAVPEPSSFAIPLISASALLSRRRRTGS